MCLVCLVSYTFLATHTADMLPNIMRGACSGTTYGSLFRNSLFIILKRDRDIPAVHAEFYSLLAIYLVNEPGKCVKLSIGTS